MELRILCRAVYNIGAMEIIDLWNYAAPVIESEYNSCSTWEWGVEYIYETSDELYQHIGIPVSKENTYLVVTANKCQKSAVGHRILSLS